jgi:predicted RNA-binding protein
MNPEIDHSATQIWGQASGKNSSVGSNSSGGTMIRGRSKDVLVLEDQGQSLYSEDPLGNRKQDRAIVNHMDFVSHKVVLQ